MLSLQGSTLAWWSDEARSRSGDARTSAGQVVALVAPRVPGRNPVPAARAHLRRRADRPGPGLPRVRRPASAARRAALLRRRLQPAVRLRRRRGHAAVPRPATPAAQRLVVRVLRGYRARHLRLGLLPLGAGRRDAVLGAPADDDRVHRLADRPGERAGGRAARALAARARAARRPGEPAVVARERRPAPVFLGAAGAARTRSATSSRTPWRSTSSPSSPRPGTWRSSRSPPAP